MEKEKTKEEIKEEVKKELEKEQEIKEKVKKEILEEQEKTNKKKNRRGNVIRTIWNIIVTLLLIFVIVETIMGVLNMQRLNEDKEPLWYLNSKVEEKDNKKITSYNIGLYVINKEESATENKVMLLPFFLNK